MSTEQTELVKRDFFDLRPSSLREALEYAKLIAESDLVPKDYRGKPGNVLVAVQMGQEVGLAPMQAVQSIAVINGRPSIWGDAALALVEASGLLEEFAEMDFVEIDKLGAATCTAVRKGRPTPIQRTFSRADAKRAKLAGKEGPWTNYEPRMLQMRARGFVLRDGFSDVLKGLHVREEAEDMPPDLTPDDSPRVIGMPRRTSESHQIGAAEPAPSLEPASSPEPPAAAAAANGDGAGQHYPGYETEVPPELIAEADARDAKEAAERERHEQQSADGPTCPSCKGRMKYKEEGNWGPWWSCANYPQCKGSINDKRWQEKKAQQK